MIFRTAVALKLNSGRLKFNSKWEFTIYKRIVSELKTQYLPVLANKRIFGSRLELDIYIPKLKLAFELQGPLHLFDIKTIQRDLKKNKLCRNLNITIIYLQFNKYYGKQYFQKVLRHRIKKVIVKADC